MFTSDRHLLTHEPHLFRDVGWSGQRLVRGTASISGTTLTFSASDVALDAAGVTAGHVVDVGGAAYEVLERLSSTQATISRPRASTDDPAIPPAPATDAVASIHTFAPQIAAAHAHLLALLGLDPAGAPDSGRPTEQAITNPGDLREVETFLALHHIFAAAALHGGAESWLAGRGRHYRRRFASARSRAAARLDLDGDGQPDATRALGVIQLMRA